MITNEEILEALEKGKHIEVFEELRELSASFFNKVGLKYEEYMSYAWEAFERAYESFDPSKETKFTTHYSWQLRSVIGRIASKNSRRHNKLDIPTSIHENDLEELVQDLCCEMPYDRLEKSERIEGLYDIMERVLTEKEQKILTDYYIEEKLQDEIAEEFELTKQAISFSIKSSIDKVRRELDING